MNISTVNELIQSLESAGELSIKETKVMELAKAYVQLAAENVALKAGIGEAYDKMEQLDDGYFSTDADGEPMDTLITLVDAQAAIQRLAIDIETPVTDAYLAGIKADGVTAALESCSDYLDTDCVMDRLDISYEDAEKRTSGAIEFHDAMVNFANQLREGAK